MNIMQKRHVQDISHFCIIMYVTTIGPVLEDAELEGALTVNYTHAENKITLVKSKISVCALYLTE